MTLFINEEFLSELKDVSCLVEETRKKIENIPNYSFELECGTVQRKSDFYCPHLDYEIRSSIENFVVIDLETTGLSSVNDRIVELSAIKYAKGIAVEKSHTYVNPQISISSEVTRINKISNTMAVDAPKIEEIIPAFDSFVEGFTVVGHNLEFDLKFLYCSGSSILEQNHKYYDTLKIVEKILKSKKRCMEYDVLDYKLPTLCKYYGITLVRNHSALFDSYATSELFNIFLNHE